MNKKIVYLNERFTHLFTYHPWLKLISLVLAIMVWFYVKGEVGGINY